MTRPKVVMIFGTRPEAIKMAPIIRQLQVRTDELELRVVVTAQHRAMLDQVIEIFGIRPDYDLDIMLPNQSLSITTSRALMGLDGVLCRERPDMVLVQGDTTTAFVGGLAAFYHRIPVGHVEAGLRTGDKYDPFPEEMNRHFVDVLADLCFVPTQTARGALLGEGIPDSRILITGNTVIDALLTTVASGSGFTVPALQRIAFGAPLRTILVTVHRRESLGSPIANICQALRELLKDRKDLQVVFPVHLNPKVHEIVWSILGDVENAYLIAPLDYPNFTHLMQAVDFVVTDSGGIQEEAPALGKPVLVVRNTTERPEAIEAGTARLIGTGRQDVYRAICQLLDEPKEYERMKRAINPFGDGHAAERIVDAILHFFALRPQHPSCFQPLPNECDSRTMTRQTFYADD
jgi:UDP-N-acetylglucosamine 2-epimerase (non-hydrolysing)